MSDYSDAQIHQFAQQLRQLIAQQDAGTLPWNNAAELSDMSMRAHWANTFDEPTRLTSHTRGQR